MSVAIKFTLNEGLYLRDPQDTVLGQSILKESILLIDEIGFEAFTFKKLSERMDSTEASVYRYFKNKHYLLIYLVSWYWEWVSYLIDISTFNIADPRQKLKIIISNIVNASLDNPAIEYVNENILHRIVISDGVKTYHTKGVDEDNKVGFFLDYKKLVEKVANVISEINPQFPYPHTLASNLFEMANNQIFFAQHLPRLTDLKLDDNGFDSVVNMLEYFAFKLLKEE